MEAPDRNELLTRLVRLERELLFVRRKLKDQRVPSSVPEGSFQAVRVQVGVGEYAIPSVCIRQIIRYAPRLSIGEEPIIVMDLGERLGLGTTVIDHETALLIACVRDTLVALIIERVCDVVLLECGDLHVPSTRMGPGACVAAVGTHAGRLVQILDLNQLLSTAELERELLSQPR